MFYRSKRVGSLVLALILLFGAFPLAHAREDAPIVEPTLPYNSERLNRDCLALAERYPGIVSLSSIGESALGKDIPLLKLGKGVRPLLWIGSLHAREVVTTGYLLLTIEEYARAYDSYTAFGSTPAEKVQWLLDEFTVYIVPMANPDGVDIVTANGKATVTVKNSATWKSNANGVNLNRNFPFDWESYRPNVNHPNNNYLSYTGPSGGSEPETKALMALCESVAFEHMVSCHCQGKVVYYRDNKNGIVPGDEVLAKTIGSIMGYSLMPSTTSAAAGWAGGFENWFRYQYKKPGICMEFCRFNTADKQTMAKFYTSDMVCWDKSQNLLFGVMDKLSDLKAAPVSADVYVDGEQIAFHAYRIGGEHYFMLRDVMYVLAGTEKQFDGAWDGENNTIFMMSGTPYTPEGVEMAGKGPDIKKPVPTTSTTLLDGQEVHIKACYIGGNNYYRMRDIAKLIDFYAIWTDGTIVIDTGLAYEAA